MSYSLSALTVFCVLGISVGQLLFKKAAASLPAQASLSDWAFNVWLLMAFVLYGCMTLLWVWILRSAPLNIAYPLMGLAFVFVPTLAWLWLGEPLHWKTLFGGALIVAGVTLAAQA